MKTTAAVALACAALAGCSSSDPNFRTQLLAYNDVRIRKSDSPGKDYIVSVKNVAGMGYSGDNPKDRSEVALGLTRPQCADARIVGESKIVTGQYLGGREQATYEVAVKC